MQQDQPQGAATIEANALVVTLLDVASARRKRFVGALTGVSLALYFGLLISVLYLPELMSSQAIGSVSFGILVVVAQLVVAGTTFWVYCWWANRFDHIAKHLADAAQGSLMHGHV
ncbi:DUF485 domain-containing protein [Nevskia soli]|uniref:DUF485 domain-containing protein n=1 Tax=Nevskia soli TaxID=418856 RepID=UPI00068F3988|nr:DUF485 domain-containing protein [Nevskia soli]